MFNNSIITSWEQRAKRGEMFHPETVSAILQHIRKMEEIMDEMEKELVQRDYLDQSKEEYSLSQGG